MIAVGYLPDRKRPAMYEVRDGAIVTLLAYFQDDAAMRTFLRYAPHVTVPLAAADLAPEADHA